MQQNRHNKVVWTEGLLLGPEHFQQLDRYHERRLQAHQFLDPYAWGMLEVAIDPIALKDHNRFTLQSFRGVLQDGTRVDVPDVDRPPPGREVKPEYFPPAGDVAEVYLAVPVERPRARNYALSGNAAAVEDSRYVTQSVKVTDESDGGNEDDITTAALSVRILFGTESTDNLERMKIAEVRRDQFGRLSLNDEFVPPVLAISASKALMEMLQNLVRKLTAKYATLSAAQRRPLSGRYDHSGSTAEVLWTLSQICHFLPLLEHYCRVPQTHPETVYRTLLQCAAQLSVISADDPLTDLPAYSHAAPPDWFQGLRTKVERLLTFSPGESAGQHLVFALQEGRSARGYRIFQTVHLDDRLFTQEHKLYLVITAAAVDAADTARQLSALPGVVTATSAQDIDSFVERAVGLLLEPATPPLGAASTPNTGYFVILRSGAAFEAVRARRTLALYVPQRFFSEFQSFQVELLVD